MEVRGIVGSTCTVKEDGSLEYTSKEKENYPRSVPCVSLIFFSAWPGVTFTPFTVDGQRQETLEEVFHSTFLRKTNSEKVSAAVVLTNTQSQDVIEFPKLLRKQYPGTIVSGGIGDLPWSTALNGQHLKRNLEKAYDGDDEELIVGFTVAGDKVESASVLLSSSVRSTKKVEEKLLELKVDNYIYSNRATAFSMKYYVRLSEFIFRLLYFKYSLQSIIMNVNIFVLVGI